MHDTFCYVTDLERTHIHTTFNGSSNAPAHRGGNWCFTKRSRDGELMKNQYRRREGENKLLAFLIGAVLPSVNESYATQVLCNLATVRNSFTRVPSPPES